MRLCNTLIKKVIQILLAGQISVHDSARRFGRIGVQGKIDVRRDLSTLEHGENIFIDISFTDNCYNSHQGSYRVLCSIFQSPSAPTDKRHDVNVRCHGIGALIETRCVYVTKCKALNTWGVIIDD